jgi:hypothetical protein
MSRILLTLVALLALTSAAQSETPPSPAAAVHAALFAPFPATNQLIRSLTVRDSVHATPAALTCCKVCSVGKACGNTCISRDKICHVGQGCACDG